MIKQSIGKLARSAETSKFVTPALVLSGIEINAADEGVRRALPTVSLSRRVERSRDTNTISHNDSIYEQRISSALDATHPQSSCYQHSFRSFSMSKKRWASALVLSLVLGFLWASIIHAQSSSNGVGAGAFYQVPLGARATALGGAYRSVADDGSGPLYNPAGVCSLRKSLFSTSYRAMQLDRSLGYITGLVPIRNEAVIGGTYLYSSSGKVEGRDSDGDLTGQEFSFTNHDIGIVFAKRFENYFAMGLHLSYVYARFVEMSAATVNVDLGVMLYLNQLMGREKGALYPVQDIQVGLVFKHLDTKYKWNNEKYVLKYVSAYEVGNDQVDDVPVEVGLGASGKFFAEKLLLASDLAKSQGRSATLSVGAEYTLSPQLALRAGFGDKRVTAGTGYLFNLGARTLAIDYAFSTDKVDEGSEHMFSIDVQF